MDRPGRAQHGAPLDRETPPRPPRRPSIPTRIGTRWHTSLPPACYRTNTPAAPTFTPRLHAAVERLPPHYRTVLALFHLDAMSYDEIVAATDLPLGTVKSYLHRARRLLKDALLAADPDLRADPATSLRS